VPPKASKLPQVIVAVLMVIALVAVGVAWYMQDGKSSSHNATPPSASQPAPPTLNPTATTSNMATPFCMDYTMFALSLSVSWDQYTSARDAGDFESADAFVQIFLAAAKNMQNTNVPSNLAASLKDMISYLTKLDAALQKGGLVGITASDSDGYNAAFNTFTEGAQTYCYG